MGNLQSIWSNLGGLQRGVVVLATVAVFAAMIALSRAATSQDLSLLYSGLEDRAAGEVIASLTQQGVPFEVRGAAIYVPTAQRDELRLGLAAQGLPTNSSQGYELLDSLSGFGTTSQMFDAAYGRAKEGELARTILSSPHILAARVHISTPNNRPFQRDVRPTAAVTVSTRSGSLTVAQANAVRYLVASSVSGLSPSDVAVIDGEGGLISDAGREGQVVDQTLSETLRAKAQRLLEARVGFGNSVVEVSVETLNETESLSERRIDPESRVAISTQVEERSNSSQDNRGADVTVASNLPAGDAAGNGDTATNEDNESRSLTNYEVSETSREVLRGPGAVRRLTVAVLVNDVEAVDATGDLTTTPRPEAELSSLSALVASAVGLDEGRGDVITIRSLPFEPVASLGTEAPVEATRSLDTMALIQMAVLALVALILGLFVVRPILSGRRTADALALPGPIPAAQHDGGMFDFPMQTALSSDDGDLDLPMLGGDSSLSNDPVTRLRQLIGEREEETIQILQSWIETPDEAERS